MHMAPNGSSARSFGGNLCILTFLSPATVRTECGAFYLGRGLPDSFLANLLDWMFAVQGA
jgi:hypothetical protein